VLVPAMIFLLWCWGGIALWRCSPGMKVARLSWAKTESWRLFARPPLFLLSLAPLGLGATYALLDSNSRGLADLLLRLRWRNE
jgi:hypothetical protein